MQLIARLLFAGVLVTLVMASSAGHVAAQRHATTTVTRLYTGADGQSHAEDIEVAWRPARLRAELRDSESVQVTSAQFLPWPRGRVVRNSTPFPGQFNQPHGIAVDSKGNVYIAENRGKRIHKFRPVGPAKVK